VLKQQSKLLGKPSKELFGKAFREHIKDTVKAKKNPKIFTTKGKDDPHSEVKTNGPFQKAPRPSFKESNFRGAFERQQQRRFLSKEI